MRKLIFILAVLVCGGLYAQELVPRYQSSATILTPGAVVIHSQTPAPQVVVPPVVRVSPAPYVYRGYVATPPPVVYRRQVYYQPLQYQGSVVYRKNYATPLRNAIFGTWGMNNYYSPATPQR